MALTYGAKEQLMISWNAVCALSMTAQSLTSTYVYAKKAPAKRASDGDTFVVTDVPTEVDAVELSNRAWQANSNILTAAVWSLNPRTCQKVAEDILSRVTATTNGAPDLSVTGWVVMDVEREYRDSRDDFVEGEKDYYMELVGVRVRLRKS